MVITCIHSTCILIIIFILTGAIGGLLTNIFICVLVCVLKCCGPYHPSRAHVRGHPVLGGVELRARHYLVRECHAWRQGESATRRQYRVTRGGRREGHVEAGESDTWRQERGTRGGRREGHVGAGESDTWGQERVTRGGRRE